MKKEFKKFISWGMGCVMTVVTTVASVGVLEAEKVDLKAAEESVLPKNPVYDSQTDTTDWDYVYFGRYPQTVVSGEALTDSIKNAVYDSNGDAVVGDDTYRYVNDTSAYYTSSNKAEGFYDWSKTGTRYYKYEPIKWRVLKNDGESLFLMADTVLDVRRYSLNDGDINWYNSHMRSWLNGYDIYAEGKSSFINLAFTDEEQTAILDTTVRASDNLLHGTSGGKNATDKIFLLSIREVINEEYGFPSDYTMYSKTRRLEPTDYAYANGIWMSSENEDYGDYCWWLLRSTGAHTKAVSMVYRFGHVYQDGYYADTPYYGVCPAIKIDIDSNLWTLVEEEKLDETNSTLAQANYTVSSDAVSTEALRWGDATKDGEVRLEDAQLVLRAALLLVPQEAYKNHCDVDGDRSITLKDAQLILRYALLLLDKFPVENQDSEGNQPLTSEVPAVTSEPIISEIPNVTKEPVMSHIPQESSNPELSEMPIESKGPQMVVPTPPPAPVVSFAPQQTQGPLVQVSQEPTGTMWIAGDSIAVEYKPTAQLDLCGWGEVIDDYFTSKVTIKNQAIGGKSSKSFIAEGNYNDMKKGMKAGDYMLISFGHNDERAAVELYTDPFGDSSTPHSYKWYLKEYYIDPAIRAGVQPVLISSVARRYFYNGEFINPQLHSPYATAMEELAEEYKAMGITVYYIDLHSKMLALYEELGEDGTYNLHAENDTTHLCRAGIDIVCDYMVDDMKNQNMSIIKFLKE